MEQAVGRQHPVVSLVLLPRSVAAAGPYTQSLGSDISPALLTTDVNRAKYNS